MPLLTPSVEEPQQPELRPEADLLHPAPEEKKEDLKPAEPLLRKTFEEQPEEDLNQPIQRLFPPRREVLVNYDWIDVVSATGYILFDGFNAKDSVGDKYTLIDASHSPALMGTGASFSPMTIVIGNSGLSFDKDFDLTQFQLPRTLEGDAFVRIPIAAGGVTISNVTIVAKIRKYTGSEVEIISTTSDTFTALSNTNYFKTLKLVVPKTHFKKGDVLRLTIQVTTDTNTSYHMGHNSNDTAVGNLEAGNSRLVVAIPFRLDFL